MWCHCTWEEGAGLPAHPSPGKEMSCIAQVAAGSQHSSPEQKVRPEITPGEQQSLFISLTGSWGINFHHSAPRFSLHVLWGQEIKDVPILFPLPCTAAFCRLTSRYLPCKASLLQIKAGVVGGVLLPDGPDFSDRTARLLGMLGAGLMGTGEGAASCLTPLPAFCSSGRAPLLLLEGVRMWARSALAFPAGWGEGCREGDAGESEPFSASLSAWLVNAEGC